MNLQTFETIDRDCAPALRIHVIVATCGRAETVCELVRHLERQERAADGVVVVGTCEADVAGVREASAAASVIIAKRGLCCQRNAGIAQVADDADVVVFFDDDFTPANDYLAGVDALMTAFPETAGLTGDLVDDGILDVPIAFEDAVRRLEVDGERPQGTDRVPVRSLYGCNMAIRLEALGDLRFDENLPLYGWLEDVDLTYQLSHRGQMYAAPDLTGIHLGVRSGRQPGRRLGYSQVANVIYLYGKGTMQPDIGWRQLLRNLAANCVKSIAPEPEIDRRGRLAGNLIAIGDFMRGRLDPRRIMSL
ncbi:glycosyltransferase [Novosphingobium sp. ZN18A2]|uniref:glycosyltransferase family 2 protein n=1 Tax=Novosphingobium sp. ZN18A2 TaxID=3079861 RepID=UPI0030D575C4